MPDGYLFFSHSGADSQVAADLVSALRAQGLGIWFDKDDLKPGDLWQQAIEKAIADASGMLIYVGARGVETWVDREVRAGLVRNTATPAHFPVIPLLAKGASVSDLPMFLSQHQAVDVGTADGVARLVQILQGQIDPAINVEYWRGHSPFRGLQTFQPQDAWLFFGRDEEVGKLLTLLKRRPVLAVLGNSGSGKSSLVRAGVIPALRRGRYEEDGVVHSWRITTFRPTDKPFGELAERLLADLAPQQMTNEARRQIREAVEAGEVRDALLRLVGRDLNQDRVLLLGDQFEEVFTQVTDVSVRLQYINALLDAARIQGDLPIHLVLTMRADFYPRCLDREYQRLKEAIEANLYGVSLMRPDKLREAVMSRLALAGTGSSEGLADLLLADVGTESGNLALLELALDRLWRGKLSVAEYSAKRGLAGVLARHADQVYDGFQDERDRKLVETVFIELVQTAQGSPDTRRTVPKSFLLELDEPARVELVLERLATARLITTSGADGNEGIVEVSHEALIRDWPALRGWLDQNRADLELRHSLQARAAQYYANQREEGLLLRGTLLATAVEWLERQSKPPSTVKEFVVASRKLAQREVRVWQLVATVMIVFATGLCGAAWYARGQQVVAESRALAANAISLLPANRYGAFTVALRAWGRAQTSEARDALTRAFTSPTELKGHLSNVNTAVFSGDGLRIVTASDDNTARVWDAASGRQVAELKGHSGSVWQAAFSPDGQRVVTASLDSTARVWDAATGQQVAELEEPSGSVFSAVFSPDGRRVLTASVGAGRVWDAASWKQVAELKGYLGGGISTDAAFSSDGRRVVVGSHNTPRVWDAASGEQAAGFRGNSSDINFTAFSPEGQKLVTAGSDHTAQVWDATSGNRLAELKGHSDIVWTAVFSPDGKRVVTASRDKSARVWDAATGKQLVELKGHSDRVRTASFSPDGQWVVTASDDHTARVWDAASGRQVIELKGHSDRVSGATFSPDGRRVVTASRDKSARVWDLASGRQVIELKGHSDRVSSADFSPDGKRVVTASYDKTAKVWDAASGRRVIELKGHPDVVWTADFSPDGKRVVTASNDRTARVWDATSGKQVAELKGHSASVLSAAFSPDGQRVVTASFDNTARVWDVATGKQMTELKGHSRPASNAAFSRDGQRVVTASFDKTARIWESVSGKLVAKLEGHSDRVLGAAFSPDGKRVVTASIDKTVRVWDATSGKQTAALSGTSDSFRTVTFSPDGQSVVTTDVDQAAQVWDAATGKFLRFVRREEKARLSGAATNALFLSIIDNEASVVEPITLDDLSRVLQGEPVDAVLKLRR